MQTLDQNKQIVQSNTFQGGLVTLMPPHLLPDGATPSCQNIDFSRSYGRLTKRHGSSRLVDATGVVGGATGLSEFITAAGVIHLYETSVGTVYEATAPSTWTPRYYNGTIKTVASIETTGAGQPYKVTVTGHGYSTGNLVSFFGQLPDTYSVSNLTWSITVVNANVFTLDGTSAGAGVTIDVAPLTGYVFKTSTLTSLTSPNFTVFNNLQIMVDAQAPTIKATGITYGQWFKLLLGTPPANGKYIETHKGRVFIGNHGAGASRLSFCALNDPEDWTTIVGASTDAGFIDVGLDDGDVITGIKSIGSVLVIFKNTSTWILLGNDPTDFKVRKVSPGIGCVAPRSIVACDTFAIFLSNLGVYSVNSDGVTMLSYNIKPTIEGWSNTIKIGASAGRKNTQYWLAINEDASATGSAGSREVVYYLDYVLGVWGKHTVAGPDPVVFVTRRDGSLISCGRVTGHINLHDDETTEDDNAVAVDAYWDTPDFDFGDWLRVKHPIDAVISAKAISAKNIVLSHIVDGVTIGTTLTFLLTPSGSKDKAFFLKRSFPSTSYGRYLRFRFRNNETAAPIEVFAYSIRAAIDERQQG